MSKGRSSPLIRRNNSWHLVLSWPLFTLSYSRQSILSLILLHGTELDARFSCPFIAREKRSLANGVDGMPGLRERVLEERGGCRSGDRGLVECGETYGRIDNDDGDEGVGKRPGVKCDFVRWWVMDERCAVRVQAGGEEKNEVGGGYYGH